MNGQDQSVNLSGMLGQIAKTTGEMGDAYKPVMQAATKPRGSMDDPAHLQRLAQWATTNGDSAAATMYMSQAREMKAEQKEAKNVAFVGRTGQIATDAQQRAQEGDVTNLDRNIAMLKERVQLASESGSATQLASAQSALKGAIASRDGATNVQTQNHAKAVTAIDAQLESGVDANGNPVDQRALDAIRARRAQLLENPEVQDTLNAEAVARGKVEREQLALEGEKYLTDNVGALREAINTGDFDSVDEIVEGADGWRAQQAVRAFADATQREVEAADKRQVLNEVQVVYDYEMIEEQVADLDPKLLEAAGYNVALKRVQASEANRIGGELKTTGHLMQAREARDAVEAAIGKARMQQASTQLSEDMRKDQEVDEEIDKLESSLETFEPKQTNVDARVRELARGLGRKDVDSDGNPEDYKSLYKQARAELRNEHSAQVNARLSQLRDPAEARVFSESEEAAIAKGMAAAKGTKTREEVIAFIDSRDGWSQLSSPLQEVEVTAQRRPTSLPQDRTSASSIYNDSFLTAGARAVGDGFGAVGDFFDERGRRAKEKLNQYRG
jgi:hypothetical protein